MSDPRVIPLAEDFETPGRDEWEALAARALRGRPVAETLSTPTPEGVTLQPLYRAEDVTAPVSAVRAAVPEGRGGAGWTVRAMHAHPDPARANADIIADLQGGAHAVLVHLDGAARRGAPAERTGDGVVLRSLDDWLVLFSGVDLARVPVALRPGAAFPGAAALLVAAAQRRQISTRHLAGTFGADPLSSLAETGQLPGPLAKHMEAMTALAAWCATNAPGMRAIEIDTGCYHAAGATETHELAYAAATGVAYLRSLMQAGMTIGAAAGQIGFCLAIGTDVFQAIAKLRAFRRIWARIIEASGGDAQARVTSLSATSASRMMSRRDTWVNALRTTASCLAAGVGGADCITVLPYSQPLGAPEQQARRMARNTQTILVREAALARVTDPAGGSYYVERLTGEFAARAWSLFQEIEATGGMARTIIDGRAAGAVQAAREDRTRALALGREVVTGVSRFPDLGESPVPVAPVAPEVLRTVPQRPPARAPATVDPDALINAAEQGADLAALQASVSGPGVNAPPLGSHRLAEPFEELRDASDRWTADRGRRPTAVLVQLGTPADYTARTVFARSYLAAGGIDATERPVSVPDAAGDCLVGSDADMVVICSSDSLYDTVAAAAVASLRQAGAGTVILAGRPGEREHDLRAAGVGRFIHAGDDMLATLRDLATGLGMIPP